MKKATFALCLILFGMPAAFALSVCPTKPTPSKTTTKTYTACKRGYYLSLGKCTACPSGGTSDDKNKDGITSCYIPAGTKFSDDTGSGEYVEKIYYSDGKSRQ